MDICHAEGREAMMFLEDIYIGTEPNGKYIKDICIDVMVSNVVIAVPNQPVCFHSMEGSCREPISK